MITKLNPFIFKNFHLSLVVILIALIQANYLLLRGPFWDGWIYETYFVNGNIEAWKKAFLENGRPLGGYLLLKIFTFFGTESYKIISGTLVCGTSWFIYKAFEQTKSFGKIFSAIVALTTGTVISVETVLASTMTQFYLGYFSFSLGLYLMVKAAQKTEYPQKIFMVAAAACAVAAVATAEAPLLLLPSYSLFYIMSARSEKKSFLQKNQGLISLTLFASIPFLLGILFFLILNSYFPASDGTRKITTDPVVYLSLFLRYLKILLLAFSPAIAVLIGFAIFVVPRIKITKQQTKIILLGFVILLLGLLPFALAGRVPSFFGWETRFLLFSGLGMGIIFAIGQELINTLKTSSAKNIFLTLLFCALISPCLIRIPFWAARQVYDLGLGAKLASERINLKNVDVFLVLNKNFLISGGYRDYELTCLLQKSLNRKNIYAVSADRLKNSSLEICMENFKNSFSLLEADNKKDHQAKVIVEKTNSFFPLQAYLFLLKKFIFPNQSFDRELDTLIKIHII